MTSETVEVPASRPGAAAAPARAGSQDGPSRLPRQPRPHEVEARLAAELEQERHVAPEHTASVAAGYFDPATQVLTWAQAGHPPPVLVRGAWAAPLDSPDGILLGAGTDGYAVASVRLRAGDLLLLYSDGLVERRDRSLDDGLATLARAARGIGDPERAIAAVLGALACTDPEDDTCLLALQVQ